MVLALGRLALACDAPVDVDGGRFDGGLDSATARDARSSDPPDSRPWGCDPATHTGCVGLCCEGGCVLATLEECSACGVGCPPGRADTCLARSCRCGEGPACEDDAPFCVARACAECRAWEDCPAGVDCVGGRCRRCAPASHAGCGTTRGAVGAR